MQSQLDHWFGLHGMTALVTGGGSGPTEGIARCFGQAGAMVLVGDTDMAAADRVVAAIRDAGGKAETLEIDVAQEASVLAAFAAIQAQYGRLDVLVNGATLMGGLPLTESTVEQWDRMYAINLRGAFLCCREAVKIMAKQGGGRIVNLSTIGALQPGMPGNEMYGPSKAGLNMLTKNVAFDYAKDNILVNAVMHGSFDGNTKHGSALGNTTPMIEGATYADGPARQEIRLPRGYADGDDIGWMAVYFASKAAKHVTGQCVAADGGFQVA
jgi:NAD(P)-dependent dehydrogenase (short-subunit alcohol dehydrogenase family)